MTGIEIVTDLQSEVQDAEKACRHAAILVNTCNKVEGSQQMLPWTVIQFLTYENVQTLSSMHA